VEHEFIPFSLDAQVGMTVWSPLAMGLLSGRYRRESPSNDGGRLDSVDLIPFDRELGFQVVDRLVEIAADHHATPAQVAIAWLLAKPCVTSVILGASTTDQLADNLGSDGLTLVDTELAELDQLTAPPAAYPAWLNDTFADARVRRALEQ
jgi:aryl-alcohol dehydrogenase-like predicted oxidoreductase